MGSSYFERIATISFAIFAMYFGAGNLIYPLRVGMLAGQHTWIGFLGFALAGVVLPVIGLLTMVLFNGDYSAFFHRLGKVPGNFLIMFCMLIIGPFFVMPRIVALSYEMTKPFFPEWFIVHPSSLLIFSSIFCLIGYVVTSYPSKIIDIVGKFLSPLLVVALMIFVGASFFVEPNPHITDLSSWNIFWDSFMTGFATLDILASIFFSSIIVTLLSQYSQKAGRMSVNQTVKMVGVSGILAGIMFGVVYLGITFVSAFHGNGLQALNEGVVFGIISFNLLGKFGAILMSLIVFLAGFTTIIALAAVVGEYLHRVIRGPVSYLRAVSVVFIITAIMANLGLGKILIFSEPFINFFYPIIIVTTFCNLAYKLFGFAYIKIPVVITACIMLPYFIQSMKALL